MEIRYKIGHKCNLDCKYCSVDKTIQDINTDKVFYDYMDKNIDNITRLNITGGEPSLYFERVVNIIKKYHNLININITTNGSNKNFIKELLKYCNVNVNISWDGIENERNYNPIDTIKLFKDKIGIVYTITNTNYKYMYKDINIIKDINKNLLKNITYNFVVYSYENQYNIDFDILEKELRNIYNLDKNNNLFKRHKSNKRCIHRDKDSLMICIEDGMIYDKCVRYKLLNDCCEIPEECLKCNVDVCNTCKPGLLLSGIANVLESSGCKFYKIIDKIVKEEEKFNFFKQKLQNISILEIIPTYNCNLNCSYCYEDCKNSDYMDINTIDNISLFIKDNNIKPTLKIFGGEPITNKTYHILNHLTNKLKNNNIKLPIKIYTNLMYLDNNIINLYKDMLNVYSEIMIQTSLNSIKEINDIERGNNNFNTVISNIKKLKYIFGNKIKIAINSVITRDNIIYLDKFAIYINNLLNKNLVDFISFRLYRDNINSAYSNYIIEKYENMFIKICHMYLNKEINFIILKAIFNVDHYYCDGNLYFEDKKCKALKNMITINPNGDVLPCNAFMNLNNYQDYIIYNINTKYINDKLYNIFDEQCINFRYRHNGMECEGCSALETCYHCRVINKISTGSFREVPENVCQITKLRFNILDNLIGAYNCKKLENNEIEELKKDLSQLLSYYKQEYNNLSEQENIEITNMLNIIKDRIS